MSTPEDQIVFEDLHGANEDKSVTIDLDVDRKVAGIETTPAEQAAADDAGNDDQLVIDELRSADDDAGQQVADDDQASTDNEDDDYSKKVKARIEREARAKRKERQRADQQTQRAAWKAIDGTNVDIVMETGLFNLTQDQAPVLVHFGPDGEPQQALLVRLDETERPEGE